MGNNGLDSVNVFPGYHHDHGEVAEYPRSADLGAGEGYDHFENDDHTPTYMREIATLQDQAELHRLHQQLERNLIMLGRHLSRERTAHSYHQAVRARTVIRTVEEAITCVRDQIADVRARVWQQRLNGPQRGRLRIVNVSSDNGSNEREDGENRQAQNAPTTQQDVPDTTGAAMGSSLPKEKKQATLALIKKFLGLW